MIPYDPARNPKPLPPIVPPPVRRSLGKFWGCVGLLLALGVGGFWGLCAWMNLEMTLFRTGAIVFVFLGLIGPHLWMVWATHREEASFKKTEGLYDGERPRAYGKASACRFQDGGQPR